MKRSIAIAVAVLVAASIAAPAMAKKKPKPVATTLYLHGNTAVGENDSMAVVNDVYLPMDATEPSEAQPKSRFILNGFVTPNTVCAGNNLFPVWSGGLSGRVKGDVKLTFHTLGTPGQVVVRIWPDVGSLLCNSAASGSSDYPEPAGEVTVDLPPGQGTVEAIMEDVDFSSVGSLMLQISPAVQVPTAPPANPVLSPFVSRVIYDSTDFISMLEFSCTPASGTSCTPK